MDFKHYTTKRLLDQEMCDILISAHQQRSTTWTNEGATQHMWDLNPLDPLHDRLWPKVTKRVEKTWGFAITDWQQPLRVSRYDVGNEHPWHLDYTGWDGSKIAFSIPLNTGYEGGRLELLETKDLPEPELGVGIIFPAFMGHRVTPVTSGQRYVLLGWLTGPRFR